MKVVLKQLVQSLVIAGMLPVMMITSISRVYGRRTSPSIVKPQKTIEKIEITLVDKMGRRNRMELEDYVHGVVLGEVSAQFHEEALKAQAVAVRTYTLYCIGTLKKHDGGAMCMNSECCQAYCEPDDYIRNGGTTQEVQKIREAVTSTAGKVLYYDSKLICATYFANSGGQTEDALEVWGADYPYLKAVVCPGEEDCRSYYDQVSMTPDELKDILGVNLTGSPSSWFGMVKYTAGGGIDLIRIGGRLYTGIELRRLFKLRSTIATISVIDGIIIIDTKGYGHRVGMSQCGADIMAQQGMEYVNILKYFYNEVELGNYESESHIISS